jgi:hypothetical protein
MSICSISSKSVDLQESPSVSLHLPRLNGISQYMSQKDKSERPTDRANLSSTRRLGRHATRSTFLMVAAGLSTPGNIIAGSRVTTTSTTVGPFSDIACSGDASMCCTAMWDTQMDDPVSASEEDWHRVMRAFLDGGRRFRRQHDAREPRITDRRHRPQ